MNTESSTRIILSLYLYIMSDTFRRSLLNRLPPMPPTRAPWALAPSAGGEYDDDDDDEEEQLEGGDTMSELGQKWVCFPSIVIAGFVYPEHHCQRAYSCKLTL
jgi:hypothetical protein